MRKRILLLFAVLMTVITASAGNYILYTSTDENVVTPNQTDAFGATIVSNTYEDGQGKIVFDGDVTKIGYLAFYRCFRLTSVKIPNSVTSIGEKAFGSCFDLKWVEIPNSVTTIGESAFRDCSSLTSIEIPNSVTSIEDGAFFYCTSLTSIEIPNSVTKIGAYTFYSCKAMTSVTISNSVTKIGTGAFANCRAITSVTVENSDPANIFLGLLVFADVTTCVLYVPAGSKELYATAEQWKDFANIEETQANSDINGDGAIDVSDIVVLVNMVLEGDTDAIGDMNGDGTIDISDIVTLVNMVLE